MCILQLVIFFLFPSLGADHVTEEFPGVNLVTSDLMDPARCRGNITAQTGLTASLYCCLGTFNKDLGVNMEILGRQKL